MVYIYNKVDFDSCMCPHISASFAFMGPKLCRRARGRARGHGGGSYSKIQYFPLQLGIL